MYQVKKTTEKYYKNLIIVLLFLRFVLHTDYKGRNNLDLLGYYKAKRDRGDKK